MASNDVRDMLNLPSEAAGSRPSKKQKTTASRPNLKGLAREVQNLGGDNPIAIVPQISSFKKRRFGSRKPAAKWEMRGFQNSARADEGSLVLRHWRRIDERKPAQAAEQAEGQSTEPGAEASQVTEEAEDSAFAKFNVKVQVPQYSDDQYSSTLTSSEWSKEETDYLMECARDLDLRWPLIWDRYDYQPRPVALENEDENDGTTSSTAVVPVPKSRTMEDLKARYYEVAARMMAVQKPVQYMNPAEFSLHQIMTDFDPTAETKRKKFAENQLGRSKEEAREEEALLVEVRRILARTEKFNQERRELYNRLDYPHTETTQDLSNFKTSNGLQTLLQNLMNLDRNKKRKAIMNDKADGQNTPGSAGASAPAGSTPVADPRRESIAASTTSGHRDSISAAEGRPEKPTKKGAAQKEQQSARRELSEQEKQIYGVHEPDSIRLSSGPVFRSDRVTKLIFSKSNVQRQRLEATLFELDLPTRPTMPTRENVEAFEKLLSDISNLLDLRKQSDRYESEIKLEQAKQSEREKKLNPSGHSDNKTEATAPVNGDGDPAASAPVIVSNAAAAESAAPDSSEAIANGEDSTTNGDASAEIDGTKADEPTEAFLKVKQEAVEESTERPVSSGGHKRSASVLSAVSDKSAKRQRK